MPAPAPAPGRPAGRAARRITGQVAGSAGGSTLALALLVFACVFAAGRYTAAPAPGGALPVAVTTQTAARFGVRPGSRLVLITPSAPVSLVVTAIVTARARLHVLGLRRDRGRS